MAAREALKYPDVEVTLVELDPEMTTLFATHTALTPLNDGALRSDRVRIVNQDAFVWLTETDQVFDFVVADFPDASSYAVGKLYTTAFYRLVGQHLSENGMLVVQATSPMFAPRAFWSIDETLRTAGFRTWPYHVYVPSFGEWGFVLAGRTGLRAEGVGVSAEGGDVSEEGARLLSGGPELLSGEAELPGGGATVPAGGAAVPAGGVALPTDLRFLTPRILPQLFDFPLDMQPLEVEANPLDHPVLVHYPVHYYEADWRQIQRGGGSSPNRRVRGPSRSGLVSDEPESRAPASRTRLAEGQSPHELGDVLLPPLVECGVLLEGKDRAFGGHG